MPSSKLIKRLFKHHTKLQATEVNTTPPPAIPPSPTTQTPTPPPHPTNPPPNPTQGVLPPFLALPGELRNTIYSHTIFPSLSTITLHQHPTALLAHPIFHLNRQIRTEALSHLCATKHISLHGLAVANEFFRLVGAAGLASLRVVTVRCVRVWRGVEGAAIVRQEVFLEFLRSCTGLRRLVCVVGSMPWGADDEVAMREGGVGAGYLGAVRDVVDGVVWDKEGVLRDEFERLRAEVGAKEAGRVLRERVGTEYEDRAEKVFGLRKVVNVEGRVAEIRLPCLMPEFLTKV